MNVLLIIAIVYIAASLIVYFFQHYFFFRPEILPHHFEFNYPYDFEEKDFTMEDGGVINSVWFKVPNSRGVVFYFKGNSRSIKGWGKFSLDFLRNGYDFFMMDYRGFGKSRGKRTETKLYNDSQQLYKWLSDHYPEDKIVIYGRSLGSGIATRIASWNKPAMLLLDSPYLSFFHQIRRFAFFLPLGMLLRYKIRTDQFINQVNVPIKIIHGTNDRLIPFAHSERLRDIAPDNITLIPVPGAGHNNLPDYAAYHEFIYDYLEEAAESRRERIVS